MRGSHLIGRDLLLSALGVLAAGLIAWNSNDAVVYTFAVFVVLGATVRLDVRSMLVGVALARLVPSFMFRISRPAIAVAGLVLYTALTLLAALGGLGAGRRLRRRQHA